MNNTSFESIQLSPEIKRAVDDAGYTHMTGIQEKIIPLIMEGKDVIGQSSTGTGKTAAFGISALQNLHDTDEKEPQVIVLCPTRELAIQVSDEFRKLAKYLENVRIVTVYGGQNIETQIKALKRSTIVVGTPGRVIDHLRRRTLRLSNIRMAVLDEADEMLDMGFLGDIRQILRDTPRSRQTVLFSATMPKEIMRITQQFLEEPVHIKGDDGNTAFDLIDQYYCEVPREKKMRSVMELFRQFGAGRGLVFCNTKVMVDRLARSLNSSGFSAAALHGDMRQSARTEIMRKFKSSEVNMLIATDVAARGIDAENIDIIINYDIPQDIEYYVHRIGRTGRAGKHGASFTLITGYGELFAISDIEEQTGVPLKSYELEGIEALPQDQSFGRSSGRTRKEEGAGGGRPPRSGEGRGARSGAGRGGDGAGRGGDGAFTSVSVDVGSEHDITKQAIEAAVIKYARVRRDEIAEINVGKETSFVRLKHEGAKRLSRTGDAMVDDFVVNFEIKETAKSTQRSRSNDGKGYRNRRGR